MTVQYDNAVIAINELITSTAEVPEAAVINAVADAARQSDLVLDEAPTRVRDTPPKAVVEILVQRAKATLHSEFQQRTATGGN